MKWFKFSPVFSVAILGVKGFEDGVAVLRATPLVRDEPWGRDGRRLPPHFFLAKGLVQGLGRRGGNLQTRDFNVAHVTQFHQNMVAILAHETYDPNPPQVTKLGKLALRHHLVFEVVKTDGNLLLLGRLGDSKGKNRKELGG